MPPLLVDTLRSQPVCLMDMFVVAPGVTDLGKAGSRRSPSSRNLKAPATVQSEGSIALLQVSNTDKGRYSGEQSFGVDGFSHEKPCGSIIQRFQRAEIHIAVCSCGAGTVFEAGIEISY